MKNYKNNWIKPAFDIPNDYREVLLTCEGYPDTLVGYYCHDTGKWKVFVDDKMETFDDVYAWKDKPRPLQIEDCFVFREDGLKDYEVREKYRTAQTMTNAIFKLLHYSIEDSNNFINKVY